MSQLLQSVWHKRLYEDHFVINVTITRCTKQTITLLMFQLAFGGGGRKPQTIKRSFLSFLLWAFSFGNGVFRWWKLEQRKAEPKGGYYWNRIEPNRTGMKELVGNVRFSPNILCALLGQIVLIVPGDEIPTKGVERDIGSCCVSLL